MNRIHRSPITRLGFTLIELLVVIVILGILAALIVPRVMGHTGEAKVATATSNIASLKSALETFRLNCDRYPTTEEGLAALVTAPSGLETKWHGPYLDTVPQDPWQHDYVYQSPGPSGNADSFTITSYGADGVEGGSGENADITDGSGN
ncbi:MAG: type II secretion system major pseudopilin GspG [Fimbriimonadaceae bacterium]